MEWLPDELRLAVFVGVNALLCVGAVRLAKRFSGRGGVGAMMDGLLIVYAIQYAIVCLTGLLGVLSAESMYAMAIVIALAMAYVGRRPGPAVEPTSASPSRWTLDRILVGGAALFVVGYLAGYIWRQGAAAFLGDDALTYHLPLPAIWLADHRISLQTIWFFNPANTYSPMAGETFIAWILAPLGNDVLVRYVQMPAMLLLLAAMIEVLTNLGARAGTAALVALGAVLCRAIIAQAGLVKDDLFLAAFFIAAVAGCAQSRLGDRLGPWRVGLAAGLFLSMKYTALPMAPLLILAIDAPVRAGWKARHWIIAVLLVLLLAGPWYVRNWVITGNPLYPVTLNVAGVRIFDGLFIPQHSTQMQTMSGAWTALTGMYQSLSPALMIVLIIGWAASLIVAIRRLHDPLVRVVAIGPLIGMAIFVSTAHAAEIRYAEPPLLLMFAATGLAISALRTPVLVLGAAAGLAIFSGAGAFASGAVIALFFACGAAAAVLGIVSSIYLSARAWRGVAVVTVFALSVWVFVFWPATLRAVAQGAFASWMSFYPLPLELWSKVATDLPPTAPLAYTNLHFIRPMMGFRYERRLVYVPVRAGITAYHDLPPSDQRLTDQQIRPTISRLLQQDPDLPGWLERLKQSPAQFLVVGKQFDVADSPELTFAKQSPQHFQNLFENDAGAIFRIIR